jgi:quercetin dioxygenase-like cupin family protein
MEVRKMSTEISEEIRIGQLSVRFLVEGGASGGSVAMFECDVPAAAKMPSAHSHDGYEETIYGLEGTTTFTVEGQLRAIAPGEALCIRRGEIHRFDNFGTRDAKFLAVITPGILGPAYFRQIAAVLKSAGGVPPDPAAIGEVMRRHGLTPAL